MSAAIIHVNRQHIAMNAKDGGARPVYTVKLGGQTRYAREVEINGPCRLVYDGKQLACGARAWIETDAEVTLVDEMTFADARSLAPPKPSSYGDGKHPQSFVRELR